MNQHEIIISGNHLELTEALKSTVQEKVSKLFRHEDRIIRVRVELSYHHKKGYGDEFIAKGHVEIDGPDLHLTETTDDLYKSIDQMVNKLDRMLGQKADLAKAKRKDIHPLDIPASIPKSY